tara:strand:+ start:3344 stop:4516 length:1173 start_codon:yes stop_codon:yes gene_type:complete
MSKNYLYHTITPENDRSDGFTEFGMADFVLNFPQRKLMAGSIRISGNLSVVDTKANFNTAISNTFIDPLVGAHALYDQMSCTFDNLGNVESVLEYGRFVKAVELAQSSKLDFFKGSSVCELKAPNASMAKAVIKGLNTAMTQDGTTHVPDISDEASFSIKPLICLNSAAGGDGTISFRKSGSIRLTLRVSRALGCLYGESVSLASSATTTASITIKNMKVHFCTIADDGQDFPLTMSNTINIKSTVQSGFANITSSVPAVCRGVTGTFIRQDRENAGGNNNPLACENIPNITSLEFLYNNTINNSLVSYQITDYAEILERFAKSVGASDHSNGTLWEVKQNDGFGIGLDFSGDGGLIDLRSQRFNIQISSGIASDLPYTLNLFFHGVQSI